MTAASIPRAAWLRIYKDLQREALNFVQYNYREFARRRIRDHFVSAAGKSLDAAQQIAAMERAKNELLALRRQTAISRLFPYEQHVVERSARIKTSIG